jgi:hypothetical protein
VKGNEYLPRSVTGIKDVTRNCWCECGLQEWVGGWSGEWVGGWLRERRKVSGAGLERVSRRINWAGHRGG